MTRQEAINLEAEVETGLAELLCTNRDELFVSLSLSNRIKFVIPDYELLFFPKTLSLDCFSTKRSYVYWNDFLETLGKVENYLIENKSKIIQLIWSYENRNQLTE